MTAGIQYDPIPLEAVLDQESQHLDQMIKLLHQEKSVLLEDPAELETLIHAKQQEVETLERLASAHTEILVGAGFSRDSSGMEACLQAYSAAPPLLEKWKLVKKKIVECQTLNAVNGTLVELGRLRVNQLISLFTAGGAGPNTYSASGVSQNMNIPNAFSVKA